MRAKPKQFSDSEKLADAIIAQVGTQIRLALPLGLGKANHVANALFRRAEADRSISLKIYTALTLEAPQAQDDLLRRFLMPLAERFWAGYPPLRYAAAVRKGSLPDNIEVHEFFLTPGRWRQVPAAQMAYQSTNYTHVLSSLLRIGINVLAQLLAPGKDPAAETVSLSCNPDLSVDLFKAREQGKIDFLAVGQLNRHLPYMNGAAACPLKTFDLLLEGENYHFPLYTLPQEPVSLADHAIGLQVARLIKDGGTLQIGIGSIGDAICHALLLRQRDNQLFRTLLSDLGIDRSRPLCEEQPFSTGLYAASEMLIEGFLPLLEAGVLKREVDGVVLHAGFFLGSPRFYQTLAEQPAELRDKIAMMPISFTNQLHGDEEAKRRARPEARFVNSAMMVTLLGGVISDGLENGQVISGVGGQYNFVAMAFALEGGRSLITLPATRTENGAERSNILWNYGHLTIPRHLRDIVVTEYGVADLRDKSDAEVIAELLGIADSRFQSELLKRAKSAGKIAQDFQLPAEQQQNTPQRLAKVLRPYRDRGELKPFPLGSDFSPAEERLIPALQLLGSLQGAKLQLARLALRGLRRGPAQAEYLACVERLDLQQPQSWREKLYRILLLGALKAAEEIL